MAKETFISWSPRSKSVERLRQIAKVLLQYAKMNITVTLRQLYYRLVSANIVANKQREYDNIGTLLSKARLAGLVDWDAIEDRVRRPHKHSEWGNVAELVKSACYAYRLPRWSNQPQYVELWCEKDALSSVLQPICDDLHVTLMVNRGYSSSTAMYDAAKRIAGRGKDKPKTVLYLGDFDPSGEDMVRDIRDRFVTFGVDVDVVKVALGPEQVKQYRLPPNPAKLTDSRAQAFIAKHGASSYEVDAIPPEDLQELVRNSITSHMDMDAYGEWLPREEEHKEKLQEAAADIDEIDESDDE